MEVLLWLQTRHVNECMYFNMEHRWQRERNVSDQRKRSKVHILAADGVRPTFKPSLFKNVHSSHHLDRYCIVFSQTWPSNCEWLPDSSKLDERGEISWSVHAPRKGTLWIGEAECHGGGDWTESSRTLLSEKHYIRAVEFLPFLPASFVILWSE